MLKDAFGLIYTGESDMRLKDLTAMRAVAAVPFGGRYRVIDFPMSNLVNSGIVSVGVITQKNYSSLMDHLGAGISWDLHRKNDGMFLLPPFSNVQNNGMYRGTIDAIKGSMDYINHTPHRYCIFQGSHTIYNSTFESAFKQHVMTGADITYIYNVEDTVEREFAFDKYDDIRLIFNERGRVIDMEIDSSRPKSNNSFMDCMIIEKGLLEYLTNEAYSRGHTNFLRDVVFKKLDTLKVYGWRYDGYVARMSDIPTYYRANMDLLKADVRRDLFDTENRIYTKVKDEVPALYKSSAIAKNCIVADGCIIEGDIEDCILFRDVRIYRGAKLKGCVIMQGCEIQEGAQLENVILDKNVMIRRDRRLVGQQTFPIVVKKQSVI